MEHNLTIIPVLNKVDLKHARPDEVMLEMEQVLGIKPEEVIKCSGKTGEGVAELLEAIVERIPPPTGDPNAPLQAMLFDSHYDDYRGAIAYVRLMQGTVEKGQKIRFLKTEATYEVLELGQFVPERKAVEKLVAGEVGYLICNIKDLKDIHIGDTVSVPGDNPAAALPGYRPPQRMVYCGLYPSDGENFEELRDSLAQALHQRSQLRVHARNQRGPRLRLPLRLPRPVAHGNHPAAAGARSRFGFGANRAQRHVSNSHAQLAKRWKSTIRKTCPIPAQIEEFRQPIVRVNFVLPVEYIGPVMQLCTDRRGTYKRTEYLGPTRAMLTFDLPLAEVIYDMHDKLKSVTRGYGTMDYELIGYVPADLVRMDILVGGKKVDALSIICDRRDADRRGRAIVKKLRTEIDRHMFEIAIQAAIGSRIIARETISAMRKNVTAKCYGGDITRKRKLWAKQKRRQEADEIDRQRRYSAEGVFGGAGIGGEGLGSHFFVFLDCC